VGQNLVQNSDASVPFTIKVPDTDEINAFALLGGFFYVDSGLILAAHNEAELAGVMAHATARVPPAMAALSFAPDLAPGWAIKLDNASPVYCASFPVSASTSIRESIWVCEWKFVRCS
jgi:hypothetical protein